MLLRRLVPAITTLILCVGLGLSGWLVRSPVAPVTMLAALVVVVTVAAGWAGLLSLPTQRGTTSMVSLSGAVAVLTVWMTQHDDRMRWLATVVALCVNVAFWHQLMRRDMRPRLVESVTGVITGVAVVSCAAGWVGLQSYGLSAVLIATCAVAVAASAVVAALPLSRGVAGPLIVLAGTAAGACGIALDEFRPVYLLIGGLCGLTVAALDRVLQVLPRAHSTQAGISVGATWVAVCGMVGYVAVALVA